MKQQATRDLFAYWNDLRGERAAPERSEIDPAAIRNILADTFMLDIDGSQRFAFRLAGTRVNALFDAEQKGASFLNLWRTEERRNVAAVLLTVADSACPVVLGLEGAPLGHDACQMEVLLLPLRYFGKTHARILGSIRPAAQPNWLGLLPPGPLTLRSLRIVDDVAAALAPARDIGPMSHPRTHGLPTGRAPQPSIPPGSPPPAALGRPHLRLIEGGRA